MKQIEFLVCVRCFTFNHAPYIKDAMDGFCMQQTSFPFVCVIVDDASTDGEPNVVRTYMEQHFNIDDKNVVRNVETDDYVMTFAQHKTNENCFFAVYYLKYNHYSIKKDKFPYFTEYHDKAKYIALCEGDDYWCHPDKLQMQVDFLESNVDYGMVHTDFSLTKGHRRHTKEDKNDDGNWFPRIITEGMNVGTATVLFRKSVFDRTPRLYKGKNWPMGDKPLWYEIAHESKIKYLPVKTAYYRVLENSASHSSDINKMIAFKNAGVEIRLFYANYYDVQLGTDGYDASYYEGIIRYACRLNEKKVAQDYYHQAKSKGLVSKKAWLFYVATVFPFVKRLIELIIKV